MYRSLILTLGFVAASCADRQAPPPRQGAAGPRLVRVSDARTPMGTYMAITVYAADEEAGRSAIADAFARVEEVEAAASTYREESEVSRLNRAAGQGDVPIGRHLAAVLERAAAVSAETEGAFDVTVGPLVALWRRTWKKGKEAADAEREAVQALVDYRAVRLAADGSSARLLKPGMSIALGGIAKGYAVDQAVAALRERGIQAALVDAGGDIHALSRPPERPAWLIGVRDPNRPGEILPRPLGLHDQAVATSGDYEQFGLVGGHRYSHILDPRRGRPIEGMTSVTVVAPDAMTADAYATAASVLGPEAAVAFAEKRPGVEILILHRRDGQLVTARSSGFDRLRVSGTAKD